MKNTVKYQFRGMTFYVTQQAIVTVFCYGQDAPSLDPGESPSGVGLSGAWEYVSPDSERTGCVVGELGPEEVR
jgi:hypothetical protein